jgi:putative heme-binding domain-containing protein
LPAKEARGVRARLGELGVQVVVVRTVPHKMVYDRSRIYVEAGKPVVIVLENADIMPHNLLVAAPGALVEIGLAAEQMVSDPSAFSRNFIPQSPKVFHATALVQPGETARLQFVAPRQPGDYPYVCTFPGHWRLMNGTLVVVPKLADVPPDQLQAPVADLSESRPFVRKWTVDDLAGVLNRLDRGRSFARGKAMFTTATCVKCHKVGTEGGTVGPDLNELPKKLADKKLSRADVLREVIEPSKVIDAKYRSYIIETSRGEVVIGIIAGEDGKAVHVVTGPDSQPRDILLKDIETKTESKVSLMPEGLLVTLSDDEILDLLAYIISGGNHDHPAFAK